MHRPATIHGDGLAGAAVIGGRRRRQGGRDLWPQSGEILRRAGSLRLTRGDIHLTTLSKKYREFCDLAIIQAKISEHAASGAVIGIPITLADLRGAFGETSLTKIRAAIREA